MYLSQFIKIDLIDCLTLTLLFFVFIE